MECFGQSFNFIPDYDQSEEKENQKLGYQDERKRRNGHIGKTAQQLIGFEILTDDIGRMDYDKSDVQNYSIIHQHKRVSYEGDSSVAVHCQPSRP
jgi:hypothetical protein